MIRKPQKYYYTGNIQPPIDGKRREGRMYSPYVANPGLVKAVNLAIALNRPLLIEGESGAGKTRLADAIAYEFSHKYPKDAGDWWCYHVWNVKSNSRAEDGLYRFDGIRRLRDAQLVGVGSANEGLLKQYLGEDYKTDAKQDFLSKSKYIDFGELGKALSQKDRTKRLDLPIVLIDEIDKADSDFPNDLLDVIDRKSFVVAETGETYPEEGREIQPLIIITSNRERPLSEAFLRRCLYFYLDFPEDDVQLRKIVVARFGETTAAFGEALIGKVLMHFLDLRKSMGSGRKLPGTSELLDFLRALGVDGLEQEGVDPAKVVAEAIEALESLASKDDQDLLGVLLKTKEDQDLYREMYPPKNPKLGDRE
jgi:MoxR-like ATPase